MTGHTVFLLLVDVTVVIVVARVGGRIARMLRQPAVVGEIAAGIALGPSLLGALPGHWDTVLFPAEVRPYLGVLAQLGLVLFMFIVGLELDLGLARGRARLAASISGCSIVLPFALGCALAVLLYPTHAVVDGAEIPLAALALFLGTAMSITAFPVLARILTDRGMQPTVPGVVSLASAAIDDVVAWLLLAFVVAVIDGGSPAQVARIVGCTAGFAAVMFLVVRPLLGRLSQWRSRAGRLTPDILAVVLAGVFASAAVTDFIGVHAIFGAFLFGAAMPRAGGEALTREILERLEQLSVLLLLPMFFVVTGLGVDLAGLGPSAAWQLVAILAVAIVGKFAGAFAGARVNGLPAGQSAAVGVLMNTRGLTELVILQVGRELGVLDDQLFALLVVMALVTTIVTEPLLRWMYPDRVVRSDIAAAERRVLGAASAPRVLVLLDEPRGTPEAIFARHRSLLSVPHHGDVVLVGLLDAPARGAARTELGAGVVPDLAAMASAVEALHGVGAMVPGAPSVRVLCRFSTDAVADLAQLAAVTEAESIVVDGRWLARHPDATAAIGPFAVWVVTAGAAGADGDAVACVVSESRSGRTAVVVAASVAIREHRPLVLLAARPTARAQRRLSADVAVLRESGLAVEVAGELRRKAGLLVVGEGDPVPTALTTPVVEVRDRTLATETRLDERLRELVERRETVPALERT